MLSVDFHLFFFSSENQILEIKLNKHLKISTNRVGYEESRTANERSRQIKNIARLLMSELLLVGNLQGGKKSGLRRK